MTREEIISETDALQNNNFDYQKKLNWIIELEKKIVDEQFAKHKTLCNKKIDISKDTELYAPLQFYGMYKNYLLAKYALHSGEYERATAFETRFWNEYQEFCNYINRTYLPLQESVIRVN